MSKTKLSKSEDKASSKALSKVKDGAVTKPSQATKAKSKEIARKVAAKEEKSSKKKKSKKEPTPEPSSSESDSDEKMESSESSSSSESESESEVEKPAKKVAPKPKTETKPKAASDSESDSESESESDDSSSSEEDKGAKVPEKAAPKAKASESESEGESSESESSSSSESSSESDESSSEDVPSKAEKVTKKPAEVNGAKKKASADDSDSDSSDSSKGSAAGESDESSSEEDSEDSDESSDEAPKTQKRKAESQEAPVIKKSKTENSGAVPEGVPETGNLFVGNLSWNVNEEWLQQEFEEFGELTGVRIVTERDTGRSRGFGYVEFANPADAGKAHAQKKDVELDGRKMNVDFANARTNAGNGKDRAQSRAQNFGDQTSPASDTLFVGNLPFSADQNALGDVFSEHGEILGIRLPTDPDSGRPKGFGYVQFSSVDEARGALDALHGSDVGGRPIRLDFSTPRQNTGDSPRGGRGGGRGGRGDRGGGRGGGRGAPRGGGGRGGSTNRGGFGDFSGKKITF